MDRTILGTGKSFIEYQIFEYIIFQIGIASYGNEIAVGSSLKIYTQLSSYVDWINKVMNSTSIPVQTSTASLPAKTSTASIPVRTSTASLPAKTSTTPRPNCALKHQQNIILSKIFIFTILISLIKNYSYLIY